MNSIFCLHVEKWIKKSALIPLTWTLVELFTFTIIFWAIVKVLKIVFNIKLLNFRISSFLFFFLSSELVKSYFEFLLMIYVLLSSIDLTFLSIRACLKFNVPKTSKLFVYFAFLSWHTRGSRFFIYLFTRLIIKSLLAFGNDYFKKSPSNTQLVILT